ncbi:MAG: VOC family protein [Pseudomonadales bacterium]|jgi:lactoylglutathione lyase|nr:VOC family protein [Pseudomonadales bacterium]
MIELAKPALDVGLQIAADDPTAMLAFHRDRVGLRFDHDLPLGGGRMQSRHGWGDSVIKLNHGRGGTARGTATGWANLTLRSPAHASQEALVDPEGNALRLEPGPREAIRIELRVTDAPASRAFFAALGLPLEADGFMIGASTVSIVEDPAATAGGLDGTGLRYVTLQVPRADDAHALALAAGAREGMAPRTLGEVARISFVVEPGGNWIELSQRASLVGSLAK